MSRSRNTRFIDWLILFYRKTWKNLVKIRSIWYYLRGWQCLWRSQKWFQSPGWRIDHRFCRYQTLWNLWLQNSCQWEDPSVPPFDSQQHFNSSGNWKEDSRHQQRSFAELEPCLIISVSNIPVIVTLIHMLFPFKYVSIFFNLIIFLPLYCHVSNVSCHYNIEIILHFHIKDLTSWCHKIKMCSYFCGWLLTQCSLKFLTPWFKMLTVACHLLSDIMFSLGHYLSLSSSQQPGCNLISTLYRLLSTI